MNEWMSHKWTITNVCWSTLSARHCCKCCWWIRSLGPHNNPVCRMNVPLSLFEGPIFVGSLQALYLIITARRCKILRVRIQDLLSNWGIMLFTAKDTDAEGLRCLPGGPQLLHCRVAGKNEGFRNPRPVSSYLTALCSPSRVFLSWSSLFFEDIYISKCQHCMLFILTLI